MAARKEALELVGLAEAAELLAISKAALWERRRGHSRADRLLPFPEPVAELRCGPIWLRHEIEEYRRAYEELLPTRDEERALGFDAALGRLLGALPREQADEEGRA
jgi:hypothetical protein